MLNLPEEIKNTRQNSRYIPLAEAGEILGTSRDYLNVLVRRGKLRAVKLGRNWFTTDEWISEYRTPTGKLEQAEKAELASLRDASLTERLERVESRFANIQNFRDREIFKKVSAGIASQEIQLPSRTLESEEKSKILEAAKERIQTLDSNQFHSASKNLGIKKSLKSWSLAELSIASGLTVLTLLISLSLISGLVTLPNLNNQNLKASLFTNFSNDISQFSDWLADGISKSISIFNPSPTDLTIEELESGKSKIAIEKEILNSINTLAQAEALDNQTIEESPPSFVKTTEDQQGKIIIGDSSFALLDNRLSLVETNLQEQSALINSELSLQKKTILGVIETMFGIAKLVPTHPISTVVVQGQPATLTTYSVAPQVQSGFDRLSATYLSIANNATINGSLTVKSGGNFNALSVSGAATLNTLSLASLTSTGDVIVGGALSVTGATTVNDITVNGNLNIPGFSTFGNSSTTNATLTNFWSTNGTITNGIITNGTIANASTTYATLPTFWGTNGTIDNLTTTNSSTTNATLTNFWSTNGTIANASTTYATLPTFWGTNGTIDNLTTTNSSTTNATLTNFWSTNGTIANASSTYLTISNNLWGSHGLFSGGLGVGVATTTSGVLQTSGDASIGGNIYISGNSTIAGDSTVIGASSANTLTVNSSINSNLIPDQNSARDLGSTSYYWKNAYISALTVNSISAASTTIGGTQSASFTINSDNATADSEDATLIFFRGTVVPNALLTWNAATSSKRFEFNQTLYINNGSASTTNPTFTIKTIASQTANALQIIDNNSSAYFTVNPVGNNTTMVNASTTNLTVTGNLWAPANSTTTIGGVLLLADGSASAPSLSFTNDTDSGLYRIDTNRMSFVTNATDRLTLDANGNVGIGTTTPNNLLTLYKSQSGGTNISVYNPNAVGYASLILGGDSTTASSSISFYNASYPTSGLAGSLELRTGSSNDILIRSGRYTGVGNAITSPQATIDIGTSDSYNNTIVDTAIVRHNTTGTAMNGLGSAISFWGQAAEGTNQQLARIAGVVEQATTTAATFGSYLSFWTTGAGGIQEKMRLTSAGGLALATTTVPSGFGMNIATSTYVYGNQFVSGGLGVGVVNITANTFRVGQCVTGDTKLRRRRKKKKDSEDNENAYDEIEIKDIKAGDEIQSLDEKTGKLIWSKVKKLAYMGIKPIYKLITASGKTIRTTGNHPYFVRERAPVSVRAIAFIDYANIKSWLIDKKLRIDFDLLRRKLETYGIKEARFYYGSDEQGKNISFFAALRRMGYMVITKPVQYFAVRLLDILQKSRNRRWLDALSQNIREALLKESGQLDTKGISLFEPKANFDVEITADALEMVDSFDVVLLFSGDGDFADLARRLSARGKRVIVISGRKFLSGTLMREADKFFTLERLVKMIPGLVSSSEKAKPASRQVLKNSNSIIANGGAMSSEAVDKKTNSEPEFGIALLSLLYSQPPSLSSGGVWTKVEGLSAGMEIAVANTPLIKGARGIAAWDKIETMELLPDEEVYDIEIENTHNFVGNGIIAHNTAFVIDSSGNVGIGNTNPLSKLNIQGETSGQYFTATSTASYSTFPNASTTYATLPTFWSSNANITGGTITGITDLTVADGGTGASTLTGILQGNGASAVTGITGTTGWFPYFDSANTILATSTIFVSTASNVGIGTTTPSSQLSVVSSAGAKSPLSIYGYAPTGQTADLFQASVSATATPAFVITSAGNIGIGTTNPGYKLAVAGSAQIMGGGIDSSLGDSIIFANTGYQTSYFNKIRNAHSAEGVQSFMTFELSTGAATTLEVLRLQGSGNVGIGITSPSQKLHVQGTTTVATFGYTPSNSAGTSTVEVIGSGDVGNTAAHIALINTWNSNKYIAGIRALADSGSGSASAGLAFDTAAFSGSPVTTERMRILSDGNVGIGTTGPGTKLEVNLAGASQRNAINLLSGGSDKYISLGIGRTTQDFEIGIAGATNNFLIGSVAGDSAIIHPAKLHFGSAVDGVAQVTFDTNGNVGIGTTNPLYKLNVVGSVARNVSQSEWGTSAAPAETAGFISYYPSYIAGMYFVNEFTTNSAQYLGLKTTTAAGVTDYRLFINNLGNVGIGTTDPAGKLEVGDLSGATQPTYPGFVRIQSAGNGPQVANNGLEFYNAASYGYKLFTNNANDYFGIATRYASATWTERLVVNQITGNVGIGTTAPGAKLEVVNTSAAAVTLPLVLTNVGASNDGSGVGMVFDAFDAAGATPTGKIVNTRIGAGDYALSMGPWNALTALTIRTSGNVGIGTTNPAYGTLDVRGMIAGVDATLYSASGWSESAPVRGVSTYAGVGSNIATFENTNAAGGSLLQIFTAAVNVTGLQGGTSQAAGAQNLVLQPNGGNVGIGTVTPTGHLQINSADLLSTIGLQRTLNTQNNMIKFATGVIDGAGDDWILGERNTTDSNFHLYSYGTAADAVTVVRSSGNVGIGTTNPLYQLELSINSAAKPTSEHWTVPSDLRLKQNISPFTDGLSVIKQINAVNYELNGLAGTPLGAKGIGVIAQEIKGIAPYTVSTFKTKLNPTDAELTELYNFDGSALSFVMINAIKELNAKIDNIASSTLTAAGGTFDLTTLNADLNLNGFSILNVKSITGFNNLWSIDSEGNIIAKSVQTQALTVGGGNASGITVYDRQTASPKCIYIEGGAIMASDGACGSTSLTTGGTTVIPASDLIPPVATTTPPVEPAPVATTTPEILPTPTTTPEVLPIATSTPEILPPMEPTATTTP